MVEEKICKQFSFMFSPLGNMKASDKTQKSSLRNVFEADVMYYEKIIWLIFSIIKRKRLTLMLTPYCQKRQSSLSLEFVCFVIRKLSVKLMWRSLFFLVYLTESYESIWNKIDHLCLLRNFFTDRSMCWSYIGNGEKQVSYHCIEVTICSVCCWCIFRLSLSFTDFISSISERLTVVQRFLKRFFLNSFSKLLYELRICFNAIPSNYCPKNMYMYPLKKW